STDGTWTYTYDAEGNLTKKSKGANAETWTYGYDQRDLLAWAEDRATDGGTLLLRADYAYDVFGNRLLEDVDPDRAGPLGTTFQCCAYDGWKAPSGGIFGNANWDIWADLDGSNLVQTRYLRGDAVDQVFARVSGAGAAAWLLTDIRGSVRDVADGTGAAVDHLDYGAFGNVTTETAPAQTGRYRFTGREWDAAVGLQYHRGR